LSLTYILWIRIVEGILHVEDEHPWRAKKGPGPIGLVPIGVAAWPNFASDPAPVP